MIILISDLLTDADQLIKGLKLVRQRGHDVMVLHIMDDDELDFPFSGPLDSTALESDDHVTLQSPRAA